MKKRLAVFVRVVEQALATASSTRNPARITGWQGESQQFEDELDPHSLALPSWSALAELADALVARSVDQFPGKPRMRHLQVTGRLQCPHEAAEQVPEVAQSGA